MTLTINRRVSGEIEGEFVLFLIGVRLNKPWKLNWLPLLGQCRVCARNSTKSPNLGMMHYRVHFGFPNTMVVQYWRSFEQLTAYAQDRIQLHLPAWSAFNKAISNNGDV